jgi:Flp pilus assembly pilin Flp
MSKVRTAIKSVARRFRLDQRGQNTVEYMIIIALVVVVVVAIGTSIGGAQKSAGTTVSNQITQSVANPTP